MAARPLMAAAVDSAGATLSLTCPVSSYRCPIGLRYNSGPGHNRDRSGFDVGSLGRPAGYRGLACDGVRAEP
jgi:hypothetical protein